MGKTALPVNPSQAYYNTFLNILARVVWSTEYCLPAVLGCEGLGYCGWVSRHLHVRLAAY